MKQFFLLVFLVSSSIMMAQTQISAKDITTFMGIPIDGTKTEMIQKLKSRGFEYNAELDMFTGQFNGKKVIGSILVNKGKVYRIVVSYVVGRWESDTRIEFNSLCKQFSDKKNYPKYFPQNIVGGYEISDEDDISYEITVKDKRYEASFYQISETDISMLSDTVGFSHWITNKIPEDYTEDEMNNWSPEELNDIMIRYSLMYVLEKCQFIKHKSVWFMINKFSDGDYAINIYYDNELNSANGEDL